LSRNIYSLNGFLLSFGAKLTTCGFYAIFNHNLCDAMLKIYFVFGHSFAQPRSQLLFSRREVHTGKNVENP
jgi:hypothetical protein